MHTIPAINHTINHMTDGHNHAGARSTINPQNNLPNMRHQSPTQVIRVKCNRHIVPPNCAVQNLTSRTLRNTIRTKSHNPTLNHEPHLRTIVSHNPYTLNCIRECRRINSEGSSD